ncbi:MAG: hypothetical protein QOK02_977 [Mycobacterium sp.]|jgi:hypothetical protein|nr:hypothetical protein [Mycobacterium sp.]
MNTQPRGLRLPCPRGCGAMLSVPVPPHPSQVVYDQPAPDMITGS